MTEKELILTSILNCSRSEIYLKAPNLNDNDKKRFDYLVGRRNNGEPLQYLLGFTEFMGLTFKVDKRALIPRPETEILVEEAIGVVKDLKLEVVNVLDIGTGSGNIAISMAKFLPQAKIIAIDISESALSLAKENAVLNNVEDRISFFKQDFLDINSKLEGLSKFDIIISNPPYIRTRDLRDLPKDVCLEPTIALDGGEDGLKFYSVIIQKALSLLTKPGLLALEIGYNQSKPIIKMLESQKRFKLLKVIKDYSGWERVIIARLN